MDKPAVLMREIEGYITAMPVNTGDIESGAVLLVEGNGKFYRVTVNHINMQGAWVVEGDYNGPIEDPKFFYKLYVVNGEEQYSIIFKDYKKIIINNMINNLKNYKFNVKPYKFKVGKSNQTCSECNAAFIAAPSQPLCKKCCDVYSTASIVDIKELDKKIATEKEFLDIALRSYKKGLDNQMRPDFEDWLTKEVKKLWH